MENAKSLKTTDWQVEAYFDKHDSLYELYLKGAYRWENDMWDDRLKLDGIDVKGERQALYPYFRGLEKFLGSIEVQALFMILKEHYEDKKELRRRFESWVKTCQSRVDRHKQKTNKKLYGSYHMCEQSFLFTDKRR